MRNFHIRIMIHIESHMVFILILVKLITHFQRINRFSLLNSINILFI